MHGHDAGPPFSQLAGAASLVDGCCCSTSWQLHYHCGSWLITVGVVLVLVMLPTSWPPTSRGEAHVLVRWMCCRTACFKTGSAGASQLELAVVL